MGRPLGMSIEGTPNGNITYVKSVNTQPLKKVLKVNSRIVEINETDVRKMNYTEITHLMKIERFPMKVVFTEPVACRRRMAQREFSSRRDSPTMVRLLEEIIAAQE